MGARQAMIAYIGVTAQSQGVEIQINKSFINRYKNRVTIQATFTVDTAMQSPAPAFMDGDLHIAGRAPRSGFLSSPRLQTPRLRRRRWRSSIALKLRTNP